MNVGTNTARPLDEMLRIPRVTTLQDQFDTAEHLPRAPGVDDFSSGHFHFYAKVALYSGNRINNYTLTHYEILPYSLRNSVFGP
jgi:hypothetical protein